jgi:hypothetical protein
MELIKELKILLGIQTIENKGKDIIVKSINRNEAYRIVEEFFKKNNYEYVSVFKKGKSQSINVLSVGKIDVVFKPIRAKGSGGLAFEKELKVDLENYFRGFEYNDNVIKHKDVIKALSENLGFTQDKDRYEMSLEGNKNQKRSVTFSSGRILISNNDGKTLTDITLIDKKNSNKKIFLSLKMSPSYYTISGSVGNYFKDKKTQIQICEFFGLDGIRMGGFGGEYSCLTKKIDKNKVKRNLENVLSNAVGTNVVIVHKKKENDVIVKEVKNSNQVSISSLSDSSYVYPEHGKRKYANIKIDANINGFTYKVSFQFRGTTASDVGPKYMRILLERI